MKVAEVSRSNQKNMNITLADVSVKNFQNYCLYVNVHVSYFYVLFCSLSKESRWCN